MLRPHPETPLTRACPPAEPAGASGTAPQFRRGDWLVYRKTEHSTRPRPRARGVVPSPRGDTYAYCVDKYWIVREQRPDGSLLIQTRRGKTFTLAGDDPNLRRPRWWEYLFCRGLFPTLTQTSTPAPSATVSS